MRVQWLWRSLRWVGLAVLLLVLVGVGGSYLWLRLTLPETRGTVRIKGLDGPVEIIRDRHGVPHIYATTAHDLFFAQGYVHAQDRPWQMDLFRRAALGRLAEIFGKELLETDRFFRTLGLGRLAQASLDAADEEARSILAAYADGVNAAMGRGRRRAEFLLLGYRPEPWIPLHTAALGKLMAWELAQWRPDLALDRLRNRVDETRWRELLPSYPEAGPIIVSPVAPRRLAGKEPSRPWGPELAWLGLGLGSGGSNSWVVDGTRSQTGKPLLANDPHLPLAFPSRWYEVHLVGAGYDVYGFSISGTPAVVIGHTPQVAWGFTNLMADDVDFFIEKPHPQDPNQYRIGNEWARFRTRQERIRVKGEADALLDVRESRHGPLVTGVISGVTEPLALRWTAQEPGQEMSGLLRMNRARSWKEFLEGLRGFGSPAQNVVYADRDGNIGYHAMGRVPIRSKWNGRLPVPGWTDEYEWTGYVPFDKLPQAFNPARHVIVTANNRVNEEDRPFISTLWEPPDRAQRIFDRLESVLTLTPDAFQRIQLDVSPPSVRANARLVVSLCAEPFQTDTRLAQALERLRSWDGAVDARSTAAATYEITYQRLLENTFRSSMGDALYQEFLRSWNLSQIVMDRLLAKGQSPWFDGGMAASVCRSFREAVEQLETRLGRNQEEWSWGRLHAWVFQHPLGRRWPLDRLLNVGPFPAQGTAKSVWKSDYRAEGAGGFRTLVGPSFRMVVDLANLGNSRTVYPGGQSEHPLSPHYADGIELWRQGEFHRTLVYRPLIEAEAEDTLLLRPAR